MARDRQAQETNAHNDPPPIPLSCLHEPRAQTLIPGTRRSRVPLMQKYGNRRGGACQNVAYCHNGIIFSGEMSVPMVPGAVLHRALIACSLGSEEIPSNKPHRSSRML